MANLHSNIPEHVKRQAMDAVAHKETTAFIRSYGATEVPEQRLFTHAQTPGPERRPIPDAVKRQAMDAVSHGETATQIRLVRDTGSVTPPITPGRESERIAGKVHQLHREGQEMERTHRTMTQDGFGREL